MYKLSHPSKSISGTIDLTASKSISNRLLIIQALCSEPFSIQHIATAQDTKTLQEILKNYKNEYILHTGPAGTVMRFLTAFLAVQPDGEWLLTGSERMLQRPIGALTGALRHLGAHISYVGDDGFPPLHIHGNNIHGGAVEVEGSLSSQYITALLLVAPQLRDGLELHLKGAVTSKPYIDMTLALMKHFGTDIKWEENVISVQPKPYTAGLLQNNTIAVEADWSAASYWYAMAALSEKADLTISGLQKNSLQGDAVLVSIFDKLGVATEFTAAGVHLTKKAITTNVFEYDFSACPDIAQTLAVVVAGLGLEGHLKGLHTLKIKETDRISAMVNELNMLGYTTEIGKGDEIFIKKGREEVEERKVATYEDHRMAMAFAPLALILEDVQIADPEVVNKSYPEYWEHVKASGFQIG